MARGLAVVAVLGVIAAFAVSAYDGVPLRGYRTLYVTTPAVGNLRSHDPVRIAGVRVGQVAELQISANGHARVRLQLEPDAPELPDDTRVAVRAAGLLGARYVELAPGRSQRMLAPRATIRAGADTLTFGVPELLETYDARTRTALRAMFGELGKGMLGQGGRLNDGIRIASGAQRPAQALIQSMLARRGAAQRLFPSLDQAATAMAASGDDLSRLFAPAAAAMRPFVDRRSATWAALDEAPLALSSATAGLREGRRLLAATRALAKAAHATLPAAPSGLRVASALLRTSHTPLRRTASLLSAARPAVPAALRITAAMSPVLGPMRSGFDELAAMMADIGPHGCDIQNFGAVFRSMTGVGFTPGGEVGALSQFRFQVIPSPAENSGTESPEAVRMRDTYSPPCKYLGGTYVNGRPGGGRP